MYVLVFMLKILFEVGLIHVITIGACRAEWVPGQILGTPHLMFDCGSVLSLHCTLYIRLYVRKHAYAGLRACRASSHPVLVI